MIFYIKKDSDYLYIITTTKDNTICSFTGEEGDINLAEKAVYALNLLGEDLNKTFTVSNQINN